MIAIRSKVARKLLNYFFLNPEQSLYLNELARKLGLDKRNLAKTLKQLGKDGLIKSEPKATLIFYSLNKAFPLYKEYRKIVLKTVGLETELKKLLSGISGLKEAYIYGSYASDKTDAYSDIDLLAVGEHKIIDLQRELSRLQREIGREINTINISTREFRRRLKNKDSFVFEVMKKKHLKII